MPEVNDTPPKAFISYSWTGSDHQEWVLKLATDLRESGVDVIFDVWDLKEGDDKYVFMEQMVTNPDVKKVLIICDKAYAEKADARKGGVGTETQIISAEVYDQVIRIGQQQKFVAIIAERDVAGQPYLPTYLKPRLYIDMSTTDLRIDN